MPSKPLSRSLIAEIHQNRSADSLEIESLDPEEKDFLALGQLLSNALQQTTNLAVLELTGLNQMAAKVVGMALSNSHCQLKALVLKKMEQSAVAEIKQALREVSTRQLFITEAGLTNSTSHAVYINLSQGAKPCQFQCTDRSHDWLQADSVNLLAPLAVKPLINFSLLEPHERLYRQSPSAPSMVAYTTHSLPRIEDINMTPNTRERAVTHFSLADEEDCTSLSACVRNLTPFTPGTTKFMQSPALTTGSYTIGRPPFFSPVSPSRNVFHAPRARFSVSASPAAERDTKTRHVSFDHSSRNPRPSGQLVCPPSSPVAELLATVMNRRLAPSQTRTHMDSPARTLLTFIPTANGSSGLGS